MNPAGVWATVALHSPATCASADAVNVRRIVGVREAGSRPTGVERQGQAVTLRGSGEPRGRARYRGPWLEAASSLRLDGGLNHPGRLARFLLQSARRPTRLLALIGVLLRTPSEVVHLSSSDAGRALRRYFDERALWLLPQNRLCRGVLLLPTRHSDYIRGRRRQALRTNVRRAAVEGIRCEPCVDTETAMVVLRQVLADRTRQPDDLSKVLATWKQLFARPEMTVLVARTRQGRAAAITAAVIDRQVCLMRVAVASDHTARWALHDHLVRELIARGVRYLLAEGDGPFGALGFEPELQHYQQLLGYELRHLAPSRGHRADPERRVPSLPTTERDAVHSSTAIAPGRH